MSIPIAPPLPDKFKTTPPFKKEPTDHKMQNSLQGRQVSYPRSAKGLNKITKAWLFQVTHKEEGEKHHCERTPPQYNPFNIRIRSIYEMPPVFLRFECGPPIFTDEGIAIYPEKSVAVYSKTRIYVAMDVDIPFKKRSDGSDRPRNFIIEIYANATTSFGITPEEFGIKSQQKYDALMPKFRD